MQREFTVKHTDGYREGPKLLILEEYGVEDERGRNEEKDEEEQEDQYDREDYNIYDDVVFGLDVPQKFHVFHLSLEIGDFDLKLLEVFDNLNDAIIYAKQQYKLYTGVFPFITTGMTSAYKATGDRVEFPMDLVSSNSSGVEECKIISNDENYDYLIIINDKHFESHSLSSNAEW